MAVFERRIETREVKSAATVSDQPAAPSKTLLQLDLTPFLQNRFLKTFGKSIELCGTENRLDSRVRARIY
jgi:hypothetical protein